MVNFGKTSIAYGEDDVYWSGRSKLTKENKEGINFTTEYTEFHGGIKYFYTKIPWSDLLVLLPMNGNAG